MKRIRLFSDGGLGGLVVLVALLLFNESPLVGLDGLALELSARTGTPPPESHTLIITLSGADGGPIVDPLSRHEELLRLLARLEPLQPTALVLNGLSTGASLSPALRQWRESAAQWLEQGEASPEAERLLGGALALTATDTRLSEALAHFNPRIFLHDDSQPQGEPAVLLPFPAPSESPWLSSLPSPWQPSLQGQGALLVQMSKSDVEGPATLRGGVRLFYAEEEGVRPTLPLRLTAAHLGAEPEAMSIGAEGGVSVGNHYLQSDAAYRFLPRTPAAKPLQMRSNELLLADDAELERLRSRLVFVVDSAQQADSLELAREVESLLGVSGYTTVEWATWSRLAALLLVGLTLIVLLPRLGVAAAASVVMVELVLLLNAQLLLVLINGEWLPLLYPSVALLVGSLIIFSRRWLQQPYQQLQERYAALTQQHARLLLNDGKLEPAFVQLQRCQGSEEVLALLYEVGLSGEQRRQFALAERVFTHIVSLQADYRDAAERQRINREAHERLVLPGQSLNSMDATMVVAGEGLQNPVLGRYQIESELGRGAMGVVYLGSDPKINRTVAIKTLALGQEFEGEQYTQVLERFMREAETAGRLNHPNIVTIYDVGEEEDLAYIAMDYLQGEGLDYYTRPETLLPVSEVMGIIEQVAEALDYAHANGVVHRDIKPANIIYNRDTQVATVTDFGVAHLADSSKTKTGTVMGSPYYMSPEQLAGTKVDGRADLFSLGVTFFQLLSGELPFQADSIAQLMYKITNSRHPSVRKLRPEVSNCGGRIVNKLLQKELGKRYQSGQQVVEALQRCLKQGN